LSGIEGVHCDNEGRPLLPPPGAHWGKAQIANGSIEYDLPESVTPLFMVGEKNGYPGGKFPLIPFERKGTKCGKNNIKHTNTEEENNIVGTFVSIWLHKLFEKAGKNYSIACSGPTFSIFCYNMCDEICNITKVYEHTIREKQVAKDLEQMLRVMYSIGAEQERIWQELIESCQEKTKKKGKGKTK